MATKEASLCLASHAATLAAVSSTHLIARWRAEKANSCELGWVPEWVQPERSSERQPWRGCHQSVGPEVPDWHFRREGPDWLPPKPCVTCG